VLDLRAAALGPDLAALAPAARALGAGARADGGGDARTGIERAWVLSGGEDHGLLATFPPDAPLPAGFRPIGTVRAPDGSPHDDVRVTVDGAAPSTGPGWDHFGG
ncbi:thiamine-phosphate kinase, partial [Isoptericola cucumis]